MRQFSVSTSCAVAAIALSGCAASGGTELPPATFVALQEGPGEQYVIGPLDNLTIHVWRNPELAPSGSTSVLMGGSPFC